MSGSLSLRWEALLLFLKAFVLCFFSWKMLQFCNLVWFALDFAAIGQRRPLEDSTEFDCLRSPKAESFSIIIACFSPQLASCCHTWLWEGLGTKLPKEPSPSTRKAEDAAKLLWRP